jgi:hypothetical protein
LCQFPVLDDIVVVTRLNIEPGAIIAALVRKLLTTVVYQGMVGHISSALADARLVFEMTEVFKAYEHVTRPESAQACGET